MILLLPTVPICINYDSSCVRVNDEDDDDDDDLPCIP